MARTTSPSVAVAVLDGFDRRAWRAAHQGCAGGLIWDRREASRWRVSEVGPPVVAILLHRIGRPTADERL